MPGRPPRPRQARSFPRDPPHPAHSPPNYTRLAACAAAPHLCARCTRAPRWRQRDRRHLRLDRRHLLLRTPCTPKHLVTAPERRGQRIALLRLSLDGGGEEKDELRACRRVAACATTGRDRPGRPLTPPPGGRVADGDLLEGREVEVGLALGLELVDEEPRSSVRRSALAAAPPRTRRPPSRRRTRRPPRRHPWGQAHTPPHRRSRLRRRRRRRGCSRAC